MISNGSMSSSRSGTFDTSMSSPTCPPEAISEDDDDSPAAPRSCSEVSVPRSSSSRHASITRFSSNGSPICTVGRLESSSVSSSAEASTDAPPMPSRPVRAPMSTSRLPTPGRGRAGQPVVVGDAQAHGVDQAVGLVGALEVDLAADGGHADGVAVVADAGHRAVQQVERARRLQLAEAQRVQDRDRPRADREHVAQDAADARGRALERLDRGRVVVRLDLERDRHAVAHVHRARVLARAHQQVRALDRQAAQQLLGVLVGAVLGPHQAEHGQLEPVGVAPHLLADELVLGVGEAELAVRRGAHAATVWRASDSNNRPPSADPVRSSTACSGWGIRPMTLPASLVTPAMSRSEPLGLCPSA